MGSRNTSHHSVLALDSASPVISVAVAIEADVVAEESTAISQSSGTVLALIDAALRQANLNASQLTGLLGVRGPGSFTGLRVGLATLLGLHQALQIPATTLTTFEVLASLAPPDGGQVLAAVDALRGDWFVQPFRAAADPAPLARPRRMTSPELFAWPADRIIGFGVAQAADNWPGGGAHEMIEPETLAGDALRLWAHRPHRWEPAGLLSPLYLRSPVVVP